jgi:hypothetical protein
VFDREEGAFMDRRGEIVHWVGELSFHAAAGKEKEPVRTDYGSDRRTPLTKHK